MLKEVFTFRKNGKLLIVFPFLVVFLLSGLLFQGFFPASVAQAFEFAENAFLTQWQRADRPIQDGTASRSWVWGPAFSEGKSEPYAESPGGKRLVQYFDKARMEIKNPDAPRDSRFFVTNGLLVNELVSGQIQVGDNSFLASPVGPSEVHVAGDPGIGPGLAYSSFRKVASLDGGNRAPDQTGQSSLNTLSQDGVPGQNSGTASYGVVNSFYENILGHNIPDVFWRFLNQEGPIYENGALSSGQVFDWQIAAGLPLTEAFWSRATIGGLEKDVLIQLFQRRVLTFTPSNNSPFQVEMGNTGQHYFTWRYLTQPPPPPTAIPTTVAPISETPGPPNWSSPLKTNLAVTKAVVRVRPTDGQAFIIGENKGLQGMFVSGAANNFSTSLNLKPGSGGEKVSADFDGEGNLHVFWQEGGNDVGIQTFYARVNAGGKQDWLRNMGNELAGGNSTGLPNVFYNRATRHLYLTHEENPKTVVFYESSDNGQTWGNRYPISSGNQTQTNSRVVADRNGNVQVVWNRVVNEASEAFAASRINGKWTNPENITQFNGSWNTPIGGLAIAPNGDVYFTYISPAPNTIGVGFIRYDAASQRWGQRKDNLTNMPPDSGSMKSVRVAVSNNGVIWLAYSLDNSINPSKSGAFFLTSANGGNSWDGPAPIFLKEGADPADIYSYSNNIYFGGTYGRQTYFSFRSQ